MNLVLISVLLGSMTVTSYRSVPNQTDSSPFYTSIGEHVSPHGVAVSRDLLKRWGGPIDYGDTIYIEGYGFKVVNDCMHQKHKNHIDMWVSTKEEEHNVNVQHKRIWIVHSIIKDK